MTERDPAWRLDNVNDAGQLARARREIDAIDDTIHDLLMRRMDITGRVLEAKRAAGDGSAFRPAREAQVLRRLAARHGGLTPIAAVAQIWREIMSASLSLQNDIRVAVHAPGGGGAQWDLARAHFGACLRYDAYGDAKAALHALRHGGHGVAVLPAPRDEDPDPWWPALLDEGGAAGARIAARLPFAPQQLQGPADAAAYALVVGGRLEPSGRDRTVLAAAFADDISRDALGALLAANGLPAAAFAAWRPVDSKSTGGGVAAACLLVEVLGFAAEDDPRLAAVAEAAGARLSRLVHLGGYAEPFLAADLSADLAEASA